MQHHAHEVRRAVLELPDEAAASESLELLQLSMAAITELQATLVTGFGNPTLSTEVARSLTAKTARLRRHLVRLSGMVEITSHFAYHDQLTGLPNRALLTDRLQQAIALAERNHTQLALLFLDLNGFKAVNDRYGHAVGDKLLQHVAAMIQGCVRDSDTACRRGVGPRRLLPKSQPILGFAYGRPHARRAQPGRISPIRA